jgi:hypothetical protein
VRETEFDSGIGLSEGKRGSGGKTVKSTGISPSSSTHLLLFYILFCVLFSKTHGVDEFFAD